MLFSNLLICAELLDCQYGDPKAGWKKAFVLVFKELVANPGMKGPSECIAHALTCTKSRNGVMVLLMLGLGKYIVTNEQSEWFLPALVSSGVAALKDGVYVKGEHFELARRQIAGRNHKSFFYAFADITIDPDVDNWGEIIDMMSDQLQNGLIHQMYSVHAACLLSELTRPEKELKIRGKWVEDQRRHLVWSVGQYRKFLEHTHEFNPTKLKHRSKSNSDTRLEDLMVCQTHRGRWELTVLGKQLYDFIGGGN